MTKPEPFLIIAIPAKGSTTNEMLKNLYATVEGQSLIVKGDCHLCWVNMADIDIYNMNVMLGTVDSDDEGV